VEGWPRVGSGWARSLSSSFAAFLGVEIEIGALPGVQVRPALVLRGIAYDRDQGQAV